MPHVRREPPTPPICDTLEGFRLQCVYFLFVCIETSNQINLNFLVQQLGSLGHFCESAKTLPETHANPTGRKVVFLSCTTNGLCCKL